MVEACLGAGKAPRFAREGAARGFRPPLARAEGDFPLLMAVCGTILASTPPAIGRMSGYIWHRETGLGSCSENHEVPGGPWINDSSLSVDLLFVPI